MWPIPHRVTRLGWPVGPPFRQPLRFPWPRAASNNRSGRRRCRVVRSHRCRPECASSWMPSRKAWGRLSGCRVRFCDEAAFFVRMDRSGRIRAVLCPACLSPCQDFRWFSSGLHRFCSSVSPGVMQMLFLLATNRPVEPSRKSENKSVNARAGQACSV